MKLSCEKGDSYAQYNLGVRYLNGDGVPMNKEEGIRLLTLASEAGNVYAPYNLGLCYLKGDGVEKNKEEGIKLLEQAVGKGCVEARQVLEDPDTWK